MTPNGGEEENISAISEHCVLSLVKAQWAKVHFIWTPFCRRVVLSRYQRVQLQTNPTDRDEAKPWARELTNLQDTLGTKVRTN